MSELTYPEELRYSEQHEWVEGAAAGSVRVGITAFAQEALGDIVYVDTPSIGATVTAGDVCGEVESTKSVSDIYSPVTGTVTAVNEELAANPGLINEDTYGSGWLFEVKLDDASQIDSLLTSEQYLALIG